VRKVRIFQKKLISTIICFFKVLNTTELDMGRHKVIARFGLMHMVATNLCEWLYTLVEETKHEIYHLEHQSHEAHNDHPTHENMIDAEVISNSTVHAPHHVSNQLNLSLYEECQRTNIMGSLVQNASPFLFPCTIEYSLICAVILFEMWKKVRSIPEINRTRKNSIKPGHGHVTKSAYHFSIDCSKAHRGMFAGIVVIVQLFVSSCILYFTNSRLSVQQRLKK
jgi:hypothetical protein